LRDGPKLLCHYTASLPWLALAGEQWLGHTPKR
jgi:hypothetical protein